MATTSPAAGKYNIAKAIPGLLTAGMSVGMAVAVYGKEMGPKAAIGRGLVEFAAFQTAPVAMTVAFLGMAAGAAVPAGLQRWEDRKAKFNTYYRPNVGGTYKDTQQASTMRQASIQAISSHKLNARNALGSEASLMHRY
jgi:hypothetical protein